MKWRRASRRSELSAAVRRHARPAIAATAAAAVAMLGPLGARRLVRARAARAGDPRPPEPLGPEAKMFRGSTPPQNTLAGPPPGFKPSASPPPPGEHGLPPLAGAQTSDVEVLVLLVDTNDHRYTGTAADLSAYRDAKHAALSAQLGPYWMEASFGAVDVRLDMRPEMLSLPGAFDDYFNRDFVAASLESRELAAAGWPRTYDGTPRATLHVRDVHKRDVDVVLAPNGTFADAAQLAANLQTGIDAITSVPADWLTCTASGGDLRFELPQHEVGEASFIRVRAPDASLGLDGPLETPGDTRDGRVADRQAGARRLSARARRQRVRGDRGPRQGPADAAVQRRASRRERRARPPTSPHCCCRRSTASSPGPRRSTPAPIASACDCSRPSPGPTPPSAG